MTDEDLGYLPAVEAAAMIRAKTLSPVELVSAVIRRVERLERRLEVGAGGRRHGVYGPFRRLGNGHAAERPRRQSARRLQGVLSRRAPAG